MAAIVVIVIAVLGLALAAFWFAREPVPLVRQAAAASGVLGFLLALLAAILSGKSVEAVIAIALIGAAVFPVVVLGQMRLIRSFIHMR